MNKLRQFPEGSFQKSVASFVIRLVFVTFFYTAVTQLTSVSTISLSIQINQSMQRSTKQNEETMAVLELIGEVLQLHAVYKEPHFFLQQVMRKFVSHTHAEITCTCHMQFCGLGNNQKTQNNSFGSCVKWRNTNISWHINAYHVKKLYTHEV